MPDPAVAPQFSIIMNVYNGAPYLRAAIDSVLAQTVGTWELILFDDCSTDDSAAICRSYADPRIRYAMAERHVSVALAREQAIRLARAPWIAFLDQDDIWLPDKLAAQSAKIAADPAADLGLIYGRTDCFDARGHRWPFDRWAGAGVLPDGALLTLLLQRPSFICLSSMVLRREAVLALLPMPSHVKLCPDYYLSVGVARAWRSACVQDLTTLYRVHVGNMTRRFRGPIHAEALDIIRHVAGPEHAAIVRRRVAVHSTWIAVEEIVSGQRRRRGLQRLLTHGSVAYLVGRPLMLAGRKVLQELRAARKPPGRPDA